MEWGNEASRGERASVLLGLDPGAEKILGQSKYGNIFYPKPDQTSLGVTTTKKDMKRA